MRYDTANTLRRAAQPVTTFECNGCGQIALGTGPALPAHWETGDDDGDLVAYCPPCLDRRTTPDAG